MRNKYRVGGYLRLSREDGDKEESDSIGSQRSIIEEKIALGDILINCITNNIKINDYIKSLGYNTEHKRFRDSNHKLFEIDIFIPEINLGIEYNGSVYHSSENGVYKNLDRLYHYNKFNECRKKNILLITIFDVEWDSRKEEIKQYIKDTLEGKGTNLPYGMKGYMNNNYPCWKHYKDTGDYLEDSYTYNGKNIVYTCGYSKLI